MFHFNLFFVFQEENVASKLKETFNPIKKLLNETHPTSVVVTHIVSPFCFYCQEVDEEFVEFEQKMHKYYEGKLAKALKTPQVNQICVAKYREDKQWYRAVITSLNTEARTIRVFFVDYGNLIY